MEIHKRNSLINKPFKNTSPTKSMKYQLFDENKRGSMKIDWLDAKFSFSFADFFDPTLQNFGALRVLNDDIIDGNSGFPPHPHKNYEIITIVTKGTLTHEDSMGNRTRIPHLQIQHMSAGNGIVHSEVNEFNEEVNSFQIWIKPQSINTTPYYGQMEIGDKELLLSPDGRNQSLKINQQAYLSLKTSETPFSYSNYDPKNIVYIMVVEGQAKINSIDRLKRDAIGLQNYDEKISIEPKQKTKFLIIEVPPQ